MLLTLTLIFLLPLTATIVSALPEGRRVARLANSIMIAMSVATFLSVCYLTYQLAVQQVQIYVLLPYVFHGVKYSFQTSKYGLMFLCTVATMYPIATIYSVSYYNAQQSKQGRRLMPFMHLAILSCFAIALSNNLATSFIFYETITLLTYPLILHPFSKQSKEASRKYLMYLVGLSSLLVIPSLIIIKEVGGTLSFAPMGVLKQTSLSRVGINVVFMAIVFGIAKTAIFPFGGWLVKAMVAPVPVSAVVHAVVVVKSGLFVIFQCITGIFGSDLLNASLYRINGVNIFSLTALATIFFATIKAIPTHHLKTRLAYSTMAQSGYSLLMFSLFSSFGMRAGMIQLIAHSVAKILLFFAVGGVFVAQKSYNLKDVNSIWRKSAIMSLAVTLGCLSILGLPPTIGFQSKYSMVLALLEERGYTLLLCLVIATFLSAYYVFDILYSFLFMPKDQRVKREDIKLPAGMLATMAVLCCLTVGGTYFINRMMNAIL